MTRAATRLASALVALACLGLSACGGDDVTTSSDPVEVEVGEAFEWNGYSVDDGWTLTGIKRALGADEVTTPEVTGTITNRSEEERAVIFEMIFSTDGSPVAVLNCSAGSMARDESQEFLCPGLSATMPEDYDAVVVQEFSRDTSAS